MNETNMRSRTKGTRGIEIKLITEELWFDSSQGQEISFFSPPPVVHIGSGAHPASYSVYNKLFFPPVVKRQEREADHSPSSSADVKTEQSYNPTPPYAFIMCTETTLLSLFFVFLFFVFGPCIFIIEEKNKPTKCTN